MENKFKRFATNDLQPKEFSFNKINIEKAKKITKMYPENYKESSIMPLLTLAQFQNGGWIPKKAIEYISDFLKVPEIKVLELATFYSMYNLSPVGDFHIEVCTTSPCMLRGSDEILTACKKKLSIQIGERSNDGKFSLNKVECLGACVNGPVIKINQNYFEDLTEKSLGELLKNMFDNKKIKIGPQSKRKGSEPLVNKI